MVRVFVWILNWFQAKSQESAKRKNEYSVRSPLQNDLDFYNFKDSRVYYIFYFSLF